MPVDMLVEEHKLIIQAVGLIKKEIDKMEANKAVNPNFITAAVDFFRTYADRYHHGKEEGILFKALSQKHLKEPDHKMMNELELEHGFARRTVTALDGAKEDYVAGKVEKLKTVLELLRTLVKLYPAHIEKEDKHFFYPCMIYFSAQEQKDMLDGFLFFNQTFTDKRYKNAIDSQLK